MSRLTASLAELLVSKSTNNETSVLAGDALVALVRAGFEDTAHEVANSIGSAPTKKRVVEQLKTAAADDYTWLADRI